MYRVLIAIPAELWAGFRTRVLTTWFTGIPTLTRHCEPISNGWEFATFFADNPIDIDAVFKMIPVGGMGINIDWFIDIAQGCCPEC